MHNIQLFCFIVQKKTYYKCRNYVVDHCRLSLMRLLCCYYLLLLNKVKRKQNLTTAARKTDIRPILSYFIIVVAYVFYDFYPL